MIYPPSNARPNEIRLVSPGGTPLTGTDRAPDTIVDFGKIKPEGLRTVADIERRGSITRGKPQFMSGFNTAIRHKRAGAVPLEGVARAERTDTFLAGYDAACLLWASNGRPETSAESDKAVADAFAIYLNTHHGANLSWDAKRARRG